MMRRKSMPRAGHWPRRLLVGSGILFMLTVLALLTDLVKKDKRGPSAPPSSELLELPEKSNETRGNAGPQIPRTPPDYSLDRTLQRPTVGLAEVSTTDQIAGGATQPEGDWVVKGQVARQDRVGISDAAVYLLPAREDVSFEAGVLKTRAIDSARTNEAGEFTLLASASPDHMMLLVKADGYQNLVVGEKAVNIKKTGPLWITLAPAPQLCVQVICSKPALHVDHTVEWCQKIGIRADRAGGKYTPAEYLSVKNSHTQYDSTICLSGLNDGVWTYAILRTGEEILRVESIAPLSEGDSRVVYLDEAENKTVIGRVVDGAGVPLSNVGICLVDAAGSSREMILRTDTPVRLGSSESDGSFSLHDCPIGRYLVGVSPTNQTSDTEILAPIAVEVEIRAEQPPRFVRLVTFRNLQIGGITETSSGEELGSVRVMARHKERPFAAQCGVQRDGQFLLEGLIPGSYELTARDLSVHSYSESETITARAGDRSVRLFLAPTYLVIGRIIGIGGTQMLGRAMVRLAPTAETNALPRRVFAYPPDGFFQFDDVSSGEYRLMAASNGGEIAVSPPFVVGAQQSRADVLLHLRVGAVLNLSNEDELARGIRAVVSLSGCPLYSEFLYHGDKVSLVVPDEGLLVEGFVGRDVVSREYIDMTQAKLVEVRF